MAIAIDSGGCVTLGEGAAGPFTVSVTTTGLNIVLVVGVLQNSVTPPTVTYNGVSMAVSAGQNCIGNTAYYIFEATLAVASGITANVVVTGGAGTTDMYADCSSYTGCSQSGIPDAAAGGSQNNASPYTMPLTTIADNAWMVGYTYCVNGTQQPATAPTVIRTANAFAGCNMYDSNSAFTPAGSHSLSVNASAGANNWRVLSLAPVSAAPVLDFEDLTGAMVGM